LKRFDLVTLVTACVDTGPIRLLLNKEIIPVITPAWYGPDGQGATISMQIPQVVQVAKALRPGNWHYLSDVPRVF